MLSANVGIRPVSNTGVAQCDLRPAGERYAHEPIDQLTSRSNRELAATCSAFREAVTAGKTRGAAVSGASGGKSSKLRRRGRQIGIEPQSIRLCRASYRQKNRAWPTRRKIDIDISARRQPVRHLKAAISPASRRSPGAAQLAAKLVNLGVATSIKRADSLAHRLACGSRLSIEAEPSYARRSIGDSKK